jgi:trigger factor
LKADVVAVNGWKRELTVEVDAEEMAAFEEKAVRKFQQSVQVDGFRKGKVPMSIIRRRFQKALESDVAEEVAEIFYRKAVKERNVEPVAPGVLKNIQFKEGVRLSFKAEVEVEPEVPVRDYKGLKVEKETWKIKEEMVEQVIEDLRQRHAEIRNVEGGANEGQLINGDIQMLDPSGVPIIGQKWEKRWIELGKAPLGDQAKSQLAGIAAGEERPVLITEKVPDEKGRPRDQERRYSVKVHSVHEKILPELDDEFAKKAGGFETVQAMRENIRRYLEADRDAYSRRQMVHRIMDEIIRKNDFELPPSVVEYALQRFIEEYSKDNRQNVSEEELRKRNLPLIVWTLKWRRLWPAIARAENIEVTEEEVQAEIQKRIQARPKDERRIQSQYKDPDRREKLKDALWEDKVVSMLIENAKIKETTLDKPAHQSLSGEEASE